MCIYIYIYTYICLHVFCSHDLGSINFTCGFSHCRIYCGTSCQSTRMGLDRGVFALTVDMIGGCWCFVGMKYDKGTSLQSYAFPFKRIVYMSLRQLLLFNVFFKHDAK